MRLLAREGLTLFVTWTFCGLLLAAALVLSPASAAGQAPAEAAPVAMQQPAESGHSPDATDADKPIESDVEEGEEPEAGEGDEGEVGPTLWERMKTRMNEWRQGLVLAENTWFDWLLLLGAILAGVVAGKVVSAILLRARGRMEQSRFAVQSRLLTDAAGPAHLALITIGIGVGLAQLDMGEPLRAFLDDVIALLIYIAIFWYVFNIVSVVEVLMRKLTARTKSDLDDRIVPLIRKTLRIFVLVVGFLIIAENVFGQDIAAWLAGLGIAGLAVSLAAQDSLKNIFGSITIFLDHPFKVGDRVNYSGYDGPVEEIGFRSTKIRTLTGHLVTVPNSRIVNDPIENIGRRPYIRRLMNVTITYDTPKEKIEQAIQIIKGILEEPGIAEPIHGKIGQDEFPPRVYFNDYNAASLNLMVIYWYFPPAYWDYIEHAERLNLRLFEEFAKAGIEFAFPTQTLYLAGDPNRPLVAPEERSGAADGEM
jgi:MscS family membrane protein